MLHDEHQEPSAAADIEDALRRALVEAEPATDRNVTMNEARKIEILNSGAACKFASDAFDIQPFERMEDFLFVLVGPRKAAQPAAQSAHGSGSLALTSARNGSVAQIGAATGNRAKPTAALPCRASRLIRIDVLTRPTVRDLMKPFPSELLKI